ncbi:SHOCT domain-containing protein [Spirillospora sp. NBC_01491]|uniref:SHOCT domain-containing protein n=1 Tax=Spirillospora sp. NBC_01491 TaxID=2976007 RepID=UPI002E33A114|nr:SHOCT domain-containing protein [Spirillospora sp. NBC_01491]
MTIHSGQEQIVWEGESRNITSRATGGRVVLHYRLTTHYLYWETGGVTGTRQQQIPLLDIQDVDVSQTLFQRTQHVGSVKVRVARPGIPPEVATLDWVDQPHQVRDILNQAIHAMRVSVHGRQVGEQRDLGVHRFEYPAGQQPGAVPPMPGAFPIPQPSAIPAPAPQPALPSTHDGPPPVVQATTPDQVMGLLRQLGELRDAGVITPEDFEAKKKDLLDRL